MIRRLVASVCLPLISLVPLALVGGAAAHASPDSSSSHAVVMTPAGPLGETCYTNVTIYDQQDSRWVGPDANDPYDTLRASLSSVVSSAYFTVCIYTAGYVTIQSQWNSKWVGEDTQYYDNETPTLSGDGYTSAHYAYSSSCSNGDFVMTNVATGHGVWTNSGAWLQGSTYASQFTLHWDGTYLC